MDTGRYPTGNESDKGSKKILEVYSGDPKLWTDFVDAATDKVRDEGGENTVKHWIGEYSEAKIKREIEGVPAADGAAAISGMIPAGTVFTNMGQVNALPEYKKWCRTYVNGPVDLKDPLKTRALKQEHYQAEFIYELAASRDEKVWNVVHPMLVGDAAKVSKQLQAGAGHLLYEKLRAEFGEEEESDLQAIISSYSTGDVYLNGKMPTNDVNLPKWFFAFEELRKRIGSQQKNENVMKGLDTDGILSFSNMKSIVTNVFLEHTTMYTSQITGAQFNSEISYQQLKKVMQSYYRIKNKNGLKNQRQYSERALMNYTCFGCGAKDDHKANDPKCPRYGKKPLHNPKGRGVCRHWKRGRCTFGK